jgi:hypothetical protein
VTGTSYRSREPYVAARISTDHAPVQAFEASIAPKEPASAYRLGRPPDFQEPGTVSELNAIPIA